MSTQRIGALKLRRSVIFSVCGAIIVASPPALAQGLFTAGSLTVNSSGAAIYSMAIQVPPSVSGLQPKLSLTYNSQGGLGPIGLGWSLEGLSAITRCPKTMAQDGVIGSVKYDSGDRFCLDGVRIVQTGGQSYGSDGSEYRTEIDSFSQIKAYGVVVDGPSYFVVKTKSGLTMEYGNTADSKIELSSSNRIRLWNLNKVSDSRGNYMTVSYSEDAQNGDFRIQRIDYAGTASLVPSNSVQFEYENRVDVGVGYTAGHVYSSQKRLTKIKTNVGSNAVKEYRIAYTTQGAQPYRSRVASVTECAADATCLLPTTFQYGPSNSIALQAPAKILTAASVNFSGYITNALDSNGDGLADIVNSQSDLFGWRAYLSKNNGDGTFQQPTQLFNFSSIGPFLYPQPLTADLNGDGYPDLINVADSPAGWKAYASLNNGSGGYQSPQLVLNYPAVGNFTAFQSMVMDVNGDGYPDLIASSSDASGWHVYVAVNSGSGTFQTPVQVLNYSGAGGLTGYQPLVMDVNGDGLPDLLIVSSSAAGLSAYASINNGNGTFQTPTQVVSYLNTANFAGYKSMAVDVNGDGYPDLVTSLNDAAGWHAYVSINKGDGSFLSPVLAVNSASMGSYAGFQTMVLDINGDGYPDLITTMGDASGWHASVAVNNGDGSFQAVTKIPDVTNLGSFAGVQPLLLDVNGDGVAELVGSMANGSGWNVYASSPATNPTVDRIVAVDNGFQSPSNITYKTLTTQGVYVKDSTAPNKATFPRFDLQYPMQVVSEIQISNGVGYSNSTAYTYGGLKAEVGTGRGMLGFRWMKALDNSAWIETYTNFSQDWPYLGLPVETGTRNGPGGSLLKRNTITLDCKRPQLSMQCWINPGNTYFPYVSQTYEESWDLNGTAFPTITTQTKYTQQGVQGPMWGDPLQITVTNSDGSSKTVDNTYRAADTSNWVLGRLLRTTVTHVKP